MMRAPSRQRGVALVLVMWVAVILGIVAASFIMERHTETLVVTNSLAMARAQAAAEARSAERRAPELAPRPARLRRPGVALAAQACGQLTRQSSSHTTGAPLATARLLLVTCHP